MIHGRFLRMLLMTAAYLSTQTIRTVVSISQQSMRYSNPENSGKSDKPCAMPMVNGFSTAPKTYVGSNIYHAKPRDGIISHRNGQRDDDNDKGQGFFTHAKYGAEEAEENND